MSQESNLKETKEKRISCPHCGHHMHLTLDASAGDQDYYEECPSCCRDIHLNMHIDEYRQKIQLVIDSDDEQVF
jgi:transcription elongation factor Elf1